MLSLSFLEMQASIMGWGDTAYPKDISMWAGKDYLMRVDSSQSVHGSNICSAVLSILHQRLYGQDAVGLKPQHLFILVTGLGDLPRFTSQPKSSVASYGVSLLCFSE